MARDIINIAGIFGLLVALIQLWKTESAAQAAKQAAESVLRQHIENFQKFAAMFAHRFANEAQTHVENKHWDMAAVRLDDLADHLAALGAIDVAWQSLVRETREFARSCHNKKLSVRKWPKFLLKVKSMIDQLNAMFPKVEKEQRS